MKAEKSTSSCPARVFRLRDRAVARLAMFCGTELSGDLLCEFSDELALVFPGDVPRPVLFESARLFGAGMVTRVGLFEFCWRLAGNLSELRAGRAVSGWRVPAEPIWCAAELCSCRPSLTRRGESAVRFKVRYLTGLACPLVADKIWPSGFLKVLARSLGYPRPTRPADRLVDPSQLVRFRFEALVDPEYCRDGRPGFDLVRCPTSMSDWNRDLTAMRRRSGGFECPRQFDHPCHRCPVGYVSCPAATHPRDYEFRVCQRCGRNGAHDPAVPACVCVACDRG